MSDSMTYKMCISILRNQKNLHQKKQLISRLFLSDFAFNSKNLKHSKYAFAYFLISFQVKILHKLLRNTQNLLLNKKGFASPRVLLCQLAKLRWITKSCEYTVYYTHHSIHTNNLHSFLSLLDIIISTCVCVCLNVFDITVCAQMKTNKIAKPVRTILYYK